MTGIEVFLDATAKFHGALTFGSKRQLVLPFLDDTGWH